MRSQVAISDVFAESVPKTTAQKGRKGKDATKKAQRRKFGKSFRCVVVNKVVSAGL
jgi:hypothetical protein